MGVVSLLELPLADTHQPVQQEVAISNLELQHIVLSGVEVGELLRPPGVSLVVADRRFTQRDGATEHLDVAVGGSQDVGGKLAGSQVVQPQLGFSQSQTGQDQQEGQQEDGKTGGHGFTGDWRESRGRRCCSSLA